MVQRYQGLREWLEIADRIRELKRVDGCDWDKEIGAVTDLCCQLSNPPAHLFDRIKDAKPGYRVLTCALSSPKRLAAALRIDATTTWELVRELRRGRIAEWEKGGASVRPRWVQDGPILENVFEREKVDLFIFPTPKWHEGDGGRYIGTGCAVLTQDPDSGWINAGAYRCMVLGPREVGIWMATQRHGRTHMDKYFARRERCPVVISVGHDPLLSLLAGLDFGATSELEIMGRVTGEPLEVVLGRGTGLPIPAQSEVVLEGWTNPGYEKVEGPFAEFLGYYSGDPRPVPVLEVETLYHRNDPILLGVPLSKPPHDLSYSYSVLRSALIQDALERAGVPDVRAVWADEVGGGRQLVTVAIRQRYPGHSKQAGIVASQCQAGAYLGRYVIVVDEDTDPLNLREVMWAVATRSDPEEDIDILRRTWTSLVDPLAVTFDPGVVMNSRAIIDACRPYEHLQRFPPVATSSPDYLEKVREKFPWLKKE
ncbi:MAG: UbiD family decarboxylase [Candidatus Binatia bacterium]|nr:UbiD family decarboxylase [Candidatus Binatia bacterium]